MSVTGVVLSVSPDWRGSALAVATTATDTVLSPVDAVDFDEDGGWLVIADDTTPRQYLSADLDADTVTLAEAVGDVFEADLPVVVWDPTTPGGGSRVVEYVALVDLDGEAGAADATIDHERIPTAGGVDFLLGATVVLEEADEDDEAPEWLVVQVVGREAAVDAGYVSPGTLDGNTAFIPGTEPAGGAASDGIAPASSPTPTLRAGISSLFIMWPEVDNADLVTYDVHLSATTGFTPSAATLVGSVAGTGPLAVKALTDGTPLVAGTTYYAKIQARDADGLGPVGAEASGSPVQATSDDIAVGAITTDMLVANDVLAGALNVTDLSTVNFESVNINGGSIYVAKGQSGTLTEEFSGTTLPAGWTATKTWLNGTGTGGANVPGTSVTSSPPTGATGSALLVDYGPAGIWSSASNSPSAAAGEILTTLASASDAEVRVRFRLNVNPLNSVPYQENGRIMIRGTGTYGYFNYDWRGISMDLVPETRYVANGLTLSSFNVRSHSDGGGGSTIVHNHVMPLDPSATWAWAHLKVQGGTVYSKLWADGDPEPSWHEITAGVPLVPGPGDSSIAWWQSPDSADRKTRGQKLWIDRFETTSWDTGLSVNPDGSGSWPSLGLLSDGAGGVSAGPFSWDVDGQSTMPSARYQKNTDQLIPSGSYTTVTWDTVEATGVTYSGGVVTVNKAGIYMIAMGLDINAHATGGRFARILINGSNMKRLTSPNTGDVVQIGGTYIGRLAAGDTVAIDAFQNSGGNLAIIGNTNRGSTFQFAQIG